MQNLVGSKRIELVSLLFFAFAIGISTQAARKPVLAEKGEKLFTQFSLFYEGDHHITTNYRKGILVPVNTGVDFVKATRNRITVRIPSYNVTVNFENEEDYSGEKIEGIFKRTFAREPVDLNNFSKEEQSAIKSGTVSVGMSKQAVIKAMGYPPRHKTPTLELNQWRYWKNRFNTILVSFEDDKVSSIRD